MAGGEPASLRDKIEAYCDLVGRPSPCDWGAKPYRFGDYARLGLPLSLIVIVVGVPLIALVWPLHRT